MAFANDRGFAPALPSKRSARLILLAAAAMLGAQSAFADPAMTLAGRSDVDSAGQFVYSLPIAVPPGTAGMAPSLSLDYSSTNGDGFEGVGWTLNGLPAVTRCPQTILLDGNHGGVNYNSDDRFCLDGQRLMATGATTYGADGSTYDTQTASFVKVISHGTAGSGPSWFEIHLKNGTVMELGNTADSKIEAGTGTSSVRAWLVDKITDVKGNYLTVTYVDDQTNGQAYPTRIDYTGNAGASLSTYNSVQFHYDSRSDVVPSYVGGYPRQYTQVLTHIYGYNGATRVLDTQLGYRAGTATLHSRLTSVTQCDGSGGNCLAPLSFSWQGGTSLAMPAPVSDATVHGVTLVGGHYTADGVTDAVAVKATCSGGAIYDYSNATDTYADAGMTDSYTHWAFSGTPPTHHTETYSGAACFPGITVAQADIDGDGYSDVVAGDSYWDGSPEPFTSVLQNSKSGALTQVHYDESLPKMDALGDFDGDGRTDGFSVGAGKAYYSVGDGTFTPSALMSVTGTVSSGDFDGDGCADLLAQGTSSNSVVFFCRSPTSTISAPYVSGATVVPGDYNGDGKTDLLFVGASSATLYLSTGTGFSSSHAVTGSSTWHSYQVVAGDWNGDGKTDVALVSPSSTHTVYLSTGVDFSSAGTISSSGTSATGVVGDWNSDGADDIWLKQSSDARIDFAYLPELVTGVSNGAGAATTIAYDRLNKNGSFYTRGTAATYPNQDLDGAYTVVSQVAAGNGSGTGYTNYHIDYSYAGAVADVTQPPVPGPKSSMADSGLLSFATIKSTDSRTGILTTTNYHTDIPYIGSMSSQTQVLGAVTLATTTVTYGGTFHRGLSTAVTRTTYGVVRNDLNGTAFPSRSTTYGYDAYNNVVSAGGGSTGFTSATTNTVTNDTTNWILGQVTESDVENIFGASDVTRHTGIHHDATTGLVDQTVLEPSTSSLKLQNDYGRDGFGNLTSVTQSGANIVTRANSTAYDAAGQFPATFTNALSQGSSATFDPVFGLVATTTDLNGHTTTYTRDPQGRLTLVTKPDGTKTALSYAFCSGVNGGSASCPTTGAWLVTVTPEDSTSAANGPVSTTYYDALGRVIASDTQGYDGSVIRAAAQYADTTGWLAKQSRPYFISGGTPQWTQYARDALGRVTVATFPDTTTATFCYAGLASAVTDANSHTKTTTLNVQGTVASVVDGQTGTVSGTTCLATGGVPMTYTYDAFGNPLTATDGASHVVTNTFDALGRKTGLSDPDLGSWSFGYDQLAEMTSQTDAKSQSTSFSYDKLQRMTLRTEADLTSRWAYDPTNGIGLLSNACTASSCTTGSPSYQDKASYDSLSRVSTGKVIADGTTYTYTQTYDGDGRPLKLTYPSGFTAKFTYNAYGYPQRIKDDSTGTSIWQMVSSDAELRAVQHQTANGVTTTFNFDAATGNVAGVCATSNTGMCDGNVANLSYGWDGVGNLTARGDTWQGYTEQMCYDSLNRLVNSSLSATCTTAPKKKTFDYDALGNITRKTDVCGTTNCMTYGSSAGPHALTGISGTYNGVSNPSFSYDANGNMTSGAGLSIGYTSYNMAATLSQGTTSAALAYSAWHGRYKMCVPNCTSPTTTTYYLYDALTGGRSEKIVTGATVTWKDYIVAPGVGLVAVRTQTGATVTWRYVVPDHLGSVVAVTDTSTTPVVERLSYDPWGKRRNANGTDNSTCSISAQLTRGYTGHEMFDSLCLVNMNARTYDPSLGRFHSADTIVQNARNSQDFNRYGYVDNNPLNSVDPSGHVTCEEDGTCKIETVIVTAKPWQDTWQYGGCGSCTGNSGLEGLVGGGGAGRSGGIETVVVEAERYHPPIYFYGPFDLMGMGVCALVGYMGDSQRLRLGADGAFGIGPFAKGGLGVSLRNDGSLEFDAYVGGGAGIGGYAGAGLGFDNAGGMTRGGSFSIAPDMMGVFGAPLYGPIGWGGSATVPMTIDYAQITLNPSQIGGGLGVGPRYGLAAGLAYTGNAAYRTGSLCR